MEEQASNGGAAVSLRSNCSTHNQPLMERRNVNRRNQHERRARSTELTDGKNGLCHSLQNARSISMNFDIENRKYSKLRENGGYHPQNGDLSEIYSGNPLDVSLDNFHINELNTSERRLNESDNYFAGRRDVLRPDSLVESKIVSQKGTCRGFKNRVRAGINTFLEQTGEDRSRQSNKNYRVLEKGKIVLYSTSVTVVRDTYDRCKVVKNILQNHMVRYEERDLCMSKENQRELMIRMRTTNIVLPQVFADGRYLGGLEEIVQLNETGELRTIFMAFTKVTLSSSCALCGGYRFIPCGVCHGSKKSVHRNNFTAEFCALRCMHCDDNGLVRCTDCLEQQE
ncbi:glutaredoxin domain-containing cysteine-rich protein CG31559-like [Liolophura sinensis]|uniref:glutaredoxin domain-containing cysteine-rich protein CG31559-like n=1 Tax=Liolophura sinensis TaxID=3198878 RepID=UPI003158782B